MNGNTLLCLSLALVSSTQIVAALSSDKSPQKNPPSTSSSTPFVPQEARALALRAEKAFASGDLKQAESFYQQALSFSPNNPQLLVSLAAVETRIGKPELSEKILDQALHLNHRNAPAWLLLGMNYLEQKRDEEAFAALVQAALYDNLNPRAHNYLGIAAGRKGWSEASEDELRRAIELDPTYADANFNLAVHYLRHTPPLLELARRHYQQAIDLGSSKDPAIEAQLAKGTSNPSASSGNTDLIP